jgi:hypothetical protein
VIERIPGGWRTVIALGVVALAAGLAFLVIRGPIGGADPNRLEAGTCFDIPEATDRIGDLTRRSCSGPHDAEVFHAYDFVAPTEEYPTDPEWEARIHPVCDEVFAAYTGTAIGDRLDIDYRYFVPTSDRWGAGDRHVTCFIVAADGSPLDRSHRAAP